ncbi:hypothetical protein DACRYDRAFT_23082 [Dacryopinax primogenitus]|uniref:Cyclin-D1-binding protein 1-like N-terminal domain-containing protein n=1 Tax=Dacryopinax primogenitus (strain DJM 731) TaxID=1858805 RepID=M5FWH7_DACPD|nr:uncharacterized protein DACRYDRAFT_23082 [Dacryopinax primogenitus]EJU00724.1 hypothetical protein DACRYDRAFT_23082 [Dacryopinax primogenitus]
MSNSHDDITAALGKTSSLCNLGLKALRAPNAQAPQSAGELPPLTVLRTDYVSLLSLLYNRALSLSLALKPPITSAAVTKVLSDVNDDLGRFTNCTLSIDDERHGSEMKKQMRWGAEEVLEGVQRTVDSALQAVNSGAVEEGDKRDLIPVAALLSAIESLKWRLPKDNTDAILRRWEMDSAALDDGVRETREMIEEGDERAQKAGGDADEPEEEDEEDAGGWDELGDGFGNEVLSGQELDRVKKVFSLLRLVTLLHKRLFVHHLKIARSPPLSEEHVVALFRHSAPLVSSTDELASALYTPQDVPVILSRIKGVHEHVEKYKTVWNAWDAESGLAALSVGEKPGKEDEDATNRKWFDMCFVQIDRVVKDLEHTLA